MNSQRTIALVLRSGKDFSFRDVELICRHINMKWQSSIRPRIICLYDKVSKVYDLGNFELHPLTNNHPGTWSRIQLYSPEMEKYRPFLYIDLDTAIIQSVETLFDLVKDETQFIPLEDFYQKKLLATGLVWFPAGSKGIENVWDKFHLLKPVGSRMDIFLRKHIEPDLFWQQLTDSVLDFKPKSKIYLMELPKNASVVCFHGKPRIHDAVNIDWVRDYVNKEIIL